jgi:hypothetical protein
MLTLEIISYKNRFAPLLVPVSTPIVLAYPKFEYLNTRQVSQNKSVFLKHLKLCPYVTILVVK